MIELKMTKRQYKALLDLVYLGDWMVNGIRPEPLAAYDDAAQLVYAAAGKAGLPELVEYDKEAKKNFVVEEADGKTPLIDIKDAYDEETFWDELVARLGGRDLERAFGADALAKMSKDEYIKEVSAAEDRWDKEFREHGIERLELVAREAEAQA